MSDIILKIVLSILIVGFALVIGLLLRRVVVRRLKKTVLDDWLIQTIGVLVTIPVIILGLVLLSFSITMSVVFITTLWNGLTAGLQQQDLHTILKDFIISVLIVILAIGGGRTIMRLIIGRLGAERIDINIRTLIARIFYGLIIMVSVFWILSLWQISIDVPIAVISAISVAFTFSIQDILKDLVAGLYILFERPFHIGDLITIATYTGKVENVELRATKIRLTSGEEITVPNAMIFGGVAVNNTKFEERRAAITITMPQEEFNKDEMPAAILKVVRETENVLVKPEPHIYVTHFSGAFAGATGMNTGYTSQVVVLTLRFWIPEGRYETVTEVMSVLHKAMPDVDLQVEDSGGNV